MHQDLIVKHILEQAQHGQLALFVGADLPREVTGLPSRADLAWGLAQRHGLKEGPLAQVAQQVGSAGNRYNYTAYIKQELAGKQPQPFHTRIVDMVQRHHLKMIITTAYDDLLEWAFKQARVDCAVVVDDANLAFVQADQLALIKLYGDAQRPESLVVTNSEHYGLLNDPKRAQLLTRIKTVFFGQTLLFLGYNLIDPDFQFLFSQIAANQFAQIAYAVWPGLDAAEVEMWRGQRIEILDTDPLGILSEPFVMPSTPASQPHTPPPPPPSSSPAGSLPTISMPHDIQLTAQEISLLQGIYSNFKEVLIEKEFGGGFSGTRVLLTLPIDAAGRRTARQVTKLGSEAELREEHDNYRQYVGPNLPFCVAQVDKCYAHAGQAALSYAFVGGGLGQAVTLEEYYRTHTSDEIIKVLVDLLDKQLGSIWYSQPQPLNCFFEAEYGRHIVERERLELITLEVFAQRVPIDGATIQLPDMLGTFPNPLMEYRRVLDQTLEGRKSYVHGDLNLRNVLVDGFGVGRLIDFAKVTERHNLYDFIKLEVHIRTWGVAQADGAFTLAEYAAFEEALTAATLAGKVGALPGNEHLKKAYQVIWAIREIARNYMGPKPSFATEYLPALFLYCLIVLKYYNPAKLDSTRLAFATAAVLARYLSGAHSTTGPSMRDSKGEGKPAQPQATLGTGQHWAVLVGVNEYEDKANYVRLQVCVKDTQALRDRLLASGFDSRRMRLLIDGGAEQPTRNNILAALQAVANATDENDLLLFYYSGHGDEANDESYLVAHDGQHVVLSRTAVSITDVKQIMEQARARAKVIILDACHSGVDFHGKGPQRMSADFIRRVFEEAQGLAILASCKQDELSYEWRAEERSVFTHYLLDALEGNADRDEKGFVTVQDANRHVVDGVRLWATQRNLTQTPTLQYSVAGDIILARLDAEADRSKASDTPETNAPPSPRQTSTSAPKRGIPADLRQHLRDVLMSCNEFGSHTQLRAVFSNADELRPFRNNLPEASDLAARVDMTISYLVDKRRADGRNALVLFFRVLSEKYEPEDERHGQLVTLADQLEPLL